MSIDAGKLAAVLTQRLEGFEALLACDRLTGGASQELYKVRLRMDGEEVPMALRRSGHSGSVSQMVGNIGLDAEAVLMSAMYAADVQVPCIYYVLQQQDELGTGFLMQWLEGEALGSKIVRSEEYADIRPQLGFQFGAALARIHGVDPRATGLDKVLNVYSPEQLVHHSWDFYKLLELPLPMLDFTARWLLERLPQNYSNKVVHADYRNGNIMINERGIVSILDWELSHLGDPVRDLGWLCVNSWRFGQRDLPVGGFATREQLLDGYESVSGIGIEPEHLRYWEVFGSFWWAIACLKMAVSYRTGDNLSPERPAIGRRSSEAQMDCVNLIIPGDYVVPEHDAAAALKQALPLAQELLGSIGHWLQHEVTKRVDSREQFMARVSANSLSIVARELTLGPQLREIEQQLLEELLGEQGGLFELRRQLVENLRADMPLKTPGLSGYLRQSVAGQLAIDQPGYSALQQRITTTHYNNK